MFALFLNVCQWLCTDNSTVAEEQGSEDFSGDQDEVVTMETTSPDVTSWMQKLCRRNYRRRCTGLEIRIVKRMITNLDT